MASNLLISTVLLAITVINTVVVTAVPEREYHSMLAALRFRGYHLFANAIATTDLHYDILTGNNFTFFAPIDSALYALDMTISATDYINVLRFHGVPRRLTLTDLRMLGYGSNSIPSLVAGHEIIVVNPQTLRSPIMVEGVDIAFPGLFHGAHIAVHGLDGIMDFRSLKDAINSTMVAANVTVDRDRTPLNVQREAYSPAPEVSDPVAEASPRSSIVTAIEPAASLDVSLAHRISVPGAQRYHQPETKPEFLTEPKEEHVTTAMRSELLSDKIQGVSLAMKSIDDGVEEFTQVNDKIIDCPFVDDDDDDDGEELSIANIGRGDPYSRELYTPTNMTCVHE